MTSKNPHSTSIISMFLSAWAYKELIKQMTYREIIGRYKGSMIGLAWSFFNPLLMLIVYTFVFSVVFKAKWDSDLNGGQGEFAVILFAGMIIFNIFAECFTRSPTLMISNASYVKKIVFPLEILPWVVLGNTIFHAMISLVVLLVAEYFVLGYIPLTIFLLPIVVAPFLLSLAGLSWFLAASGVYIRDLGQLVGILTTVLMFTSPLFFPLSALPESMQPWLMLNPLAYFIEEARAVIIFGIYPSLSNLLIAYTASLLVAYLGFSWFQKTRKGFADVL
tara:strand:+ start:13861 stop:14691 length:831 start_codon:yes stop_codon:yes gene_type:complete